MVHLCFHDVDGLHTLKHCEKCSETWKKSLVKTKYELFEIPNSSHNFGRCKKLFSFSLYNQFCWENSGTWDFSSQSWETQNDLILVDVQNGYNTTTSNYQYSWSYGPISSYFWVLSPFMAMFSDHNLWTTYLNFTFLSIFRNVLRYLIHLSHENKGVPLNIFTFPGK